MKISKALLGAILVGIAVQTTATSCSKKEVSPVKTDTGAPGEQVQPPHSNPPPTPPPGGDCPACGMG